MDSTYANIPERVRHFLLGLDGADAFERVLEASGLSEQALFPLSNVVMDFAEKLFLIEELDDQLAKALSLSPATAARVAVALGREILLPFKEDFAIPDLEARMSVWEGKARVGSLAMQEGPTETPETFVLSSLSTIAPTVTDETLKHRLELALLSYVRGERDAAATLGLFTRALKVGGLALEESEARSLLAATDAALAHVRITDEEVEEGRGPRAEVQEEQTIEPVIPDAPRTSHPAPPNPIFLDIIPPDHQIVAAETRVEIPVLTPEPLLIEEQTLHPLEEEGRGPRAEGREEVAPRTPHLAPPITPDHFSEADAEEVRAFEGRAKDAGALAAKTDPANIVEATLLKIPQTGFDEEAIKRLKNIVDARLRNVRDAYATRALLEAGEERGGVALRGRALADALQIIEDAAVSEEARLLAAQKQTFADDLAKRRAARTAEEDEVRGSRAEAREGDEKSQTVPRTSHPAPPAPHPDVLPIKQAVLSAASVSNTPGERPRLDDIRSAPRLVGPLEELQTMSLTDFRRLSPDPATAMAKIRDKVALLEDQGFEKKIAAVNAWRSSPLSQLYLEISREALQTGMPILPLLEQRKARGEEVLTSNEWHVVMTLNGELRF